MENTIALCYSPSNSILHIPRNSKLLSNALMTASENRLKNLILLIGNDTIIDFANRNGLNESYLSQIKNRTRKMGDTLARKIETATGKPVGWMDVDRKVGGMNMHPVNEANASYAPTLAPGRKVPVVGTAQLGDNGYWVEMEYPTGEGDGFVRFSSRDENAYALRCRGDSMKPRIKDGEFVIIEPNSEPIPGDEVLVKSTDGKVMVKTFLYRREGLLYLMSVNEAHPPISLPLENVDKFHLVAGIVKKALWASN